MTRRDLIFSAAAAPAMTAPVPGPMPKALRLGGPAFLKSDDPRELAREHRRLGYAAAYCPKSSPKDSTRLSAIEDAFRAENVTIAEVGVWVNLLDPDADRRRENMRLVTDGLAVAEAVGARCCVDIAGSFNPKVWYGPDPRNLMREFFDAVVENARKIIDAVAPKRTKFTYEMMGWNLPDSADSYLAMIRAVDRKSFGVHIDICNVINTPQRFYNNRAVTEECFKKLGQWIASCHAKDLDWIPEMNLHFVEVVPGRGKLDYRAYLKNLATYAPDAPLMLEHLKTAEEYGEGAAYIRKIASEIHLEWV